MLEGCWRESGWGFSERERGKFVIFPDGQCRCRIIPHPWALFLYILHNRKVAQKTFRCEKKCWMGAGWRVYLISTIERSIKNLFGAKRNIGMVLAVEWVVVLGAGARQIRNSSRWLMSMQNNSAPVSIVCSPQSKRFPKTFSVQKEILEWYWR